MRSRVASLALWIEPLQLSRLVENRVSTYCGSDSARSALASSQSQRTRFARSSASQGSVARLPEFSSRLRRAVVVWIRGVLEIPPAYMPEVDFLEPEHETDLAIDSGHMSVQWNQPGWIKVGERVVQPPCINSFLHEGDLSHRGHSVVIYI